MDLYLFCLGLSFCGLFVVALAGLGHHGHHGHGGHGRTGGFKLHQGPGHVHHAPGHHAAHGHGGPSGWSTAGLLLLGLFSPRTFLSMLLGFGATGLVLRSLAVWPPVLLFVLAAIGGLAFDRLIMQPVWGFLMGFASDPARTLDTAVQQESIAATDFDADGRGLVAIELDGQVRQILGRLCSEERAQTTGRVRTGERLVIRSVDDRCNTCLVSRLRSC